MLVPTPSWETKQKAKQFLELKMNITCSEVVLGNQDCHEQALPQTAGRTFTP